SPPSLGTCQSSPLRPKGPRDLSLLLGVRRPPLRLRARDLSLHLGVRRHRPAPPEGPRPVAPISLGVRRLRSPWPEGPRPVAPRLGGSGARRSA
ncbi:unnamed protein product, partial [Staurois parvus]